MYNFYDVYLPGSHIVSIEALPEEEAIGV